MKVYLDNFSHANAGLQAPEIIASCERRGPLLRGENARRQGAGPWTATCPTTRSSGWPNAAVTASAATRCSVPASTLSSGSSRTRIAVR